MRIDIKMNGKKVKDKDIRALYILNYALDKSSCDRMKIVNLQYIADRMGFILVKK